MRKVETSALVILLVVGFAVNAIPATTSTVSTQEESSATYLTLDDTEIFVPELRYNVTVYRDNWGVPHIYARRNSDAYYAWGYVMAQDRMFEMDMFRRAVSGRLSELQGSSTLDQDILMRRLGMYKIGEKSLQNVPSDILESVEQFANGVNRYIADLEVPTTVPFEYKVLNSMGLPWEQCLPYNWSAPDSMAIAGMMGLMLTDSSQEELRRGLFMQNVEPEIPGATDFLMPSQWINMTTIMPSDLPSEGFSVKSVTEPIRKLLGFSGSLGSNNWVIDSTKSATGNAILCNDPHLDLQTPGINWQVHVKTDEFNVIGCCIPGGPVVYTGHNDHIAWGVTNFGADVVDLYYYVLDNPENPTQYWYIDHWEPINVTYETINVFGQAPVEIPIYSTIHGPFDIPGIGKYAFRWSGHERGYGEVEGFYRVMKARNHAEWAEALTHMTVIIQNYVYADKQGNIAWWPSGAIPIRSTAGVPTMGMIPSNGSAGQNEWVGFIPHEEMPHSLNPEQHFIATANNQPTRPDYPHWIAPAYYFAPGYRGERITELLTSKPQLTIEDMMATQGDSLSIPARVFTPYILAAYPSRPVPDPRMEKTLTYLQNWNYTMLRNLVAPLIFEVWFDNYQSNTFLDELGPHGAYPFENMIIPIRNMTEGYPTSPYSTYFFDIKGTSKNETRDDIIRKSLEDAVNWLTNRLGVNMESWQYGELHVVQFQHLIGGFFPSLNIPATPAPCDGSAYTVDPGGHHHELIVQKSYLFVEAGASYRGIYECKDGWDTSLIIVPPGENGYITGSVSTPVPGPHYDDTFLKWLNNQYNPCLFNDTSIQTDYETRITFYTLAQPLIGDINGDGIVDIFDVVILAKAFGSKPGDPNWNQAADLNSDDVVDIFDVVTIAKNFGSTA